VGGGGGGGGGGGRVAGGECFGRFRPFMVAWIGGASSVCSVPWCVVVEDPPTTTESEKARGGQRGKKGKEISQKRRKRERFSGEIFRREQTTAEWGKGG